MKPNSFETTLARPKLVVQDYSHTISKQTPNICIIHIVEPEVITTDVQNFQKLVQRLTGKPVERKGNMNMVKRTSSLIMHPKPYCSKAGKKVVSTGTPTLKDAQRVKKENDETNDAENELWHFLGELDGFLHDMNEFPLFSIGPSQINNISGEASLLAENFRMS